MAFSVWRTEKWENGPWAHLSWRPGVSACLFSRTGPGQGSPWSGGLFSPLGPVVSPGCCLVGLGAFSPHLLPPSHSPVLTGAWPDCCGVGGFRWEGLVRNGWEALFFPRGLGAALGLGHFPGPGQTPAAAAHGSCLGVCPRPERPGRAWQGTTQLSLVLSTLSPRSAWRSSP